MLLHEDIKMAISNGQIVIEPYNPKYLGPNSYDLHLGSTLMVYTDEILDVTKNNPVRSFEIPEEGFVLQPGELYLGSTVEKAGSDYFVPGYDGRSSMARLGIGSHISAGFGDIGFKSNWTLEIVVVKPVRVRAHMKIGQIFFYNANQLSNIKEKRYNGKYTVQPNPQPSKSYKDFTEPVIIPLYKNRLWGGC